jgi:cytochrome c oxidase subunit 2
MTKIFSGLFLLAAVAFFGFACPQQETPAPSSSPDPVTTTTPDTTPETTPAPGAVKSFSVTAKQWEFSPSVLTVKEGDTVRLSITSVDVMHGFALSAFGINETLEPGKTVDVEFVADKSGSFNFFCTVFCGSGHGNMKGTLVVE